MEWLAEIPEYFIVTGVGIALATFYWWRRSIEGLTPAQLATDEERTKLIELIQSRITELERKVERLEKENELLRLENKRLTEECLDAWTDGT